MREGKREARDERRDPKSASAIIPQVYSSYQSDQVLSYQSGGLYPFCNPSSRLRLEAVRESERRAPPRVSPSPAAPLLRRLSLPPPLCRRYSERHILPSLARPYALPLCLPFHPSPLPSPTVSPSRLLSPRTLLSHPHQNAHTTPLRQRHQKQKLNPPTPLLCRSQSRAVRSGGGGRWIQGGDDEGGESGVGED